MERLAKAIGSVSLESFTVEFSALRSLDSALVPLAKTLSHYPFTSLQRLKIEAPDYFDSNVEEALVKMLESNYALQSLKLMVMSPHVGGEYTPWYGAKRTEMDMYLRLNRHGRKHLMQNVERVSRKEWVNALSSLSNDLDCLHYYLRENSWLCKLDALDDKQPKEVSKKRKISDVLNAMEDIYRNATEEATKASKQLLQVAWNEQGEENNCAKDTVEMMIRSHSLEKSKLEDEIQRLRKENAALKKSQP